MAKIAYILLCHKDPEAVIRQALHLTASGDYLAIHLDGRATRAAFHQLQSALGGQDSIRFTRRRIKCGWGEWSLVAATFEALDCARRNFPDATHFYLISGDCMPIKSAEYIHEFLDADNLDHIESHDFFGSDWIRTGMKKERIAYRHLFNERKQEKLFYAAIDLQKRLGLERQPPRDLSIRIGSQWWCLRRTTVEALIDFIGSRRDVRRFFATTWIPDEICFQTLVSHLVPRAEISNRAPTFLLFSDYGMPVTFHNDHYDLLLGQAALFARKISPEAHDLRERLGALFAQTGLSFEISGEGEALYHFLAGRGRIGQRFARRIWETEASLGRERELLIVICKKWHLAKRLIDRIRHLTNTPASAYIFNEMEAPQPELGGIETSLEKRSRHRRAVMRMIFEHHQTDRMIICMDPASFDAVADFADDRATTRLLEIDCTFSDDELIGHAQRIGLVGPSATPTTLDKLLPTLRNDIGCETERLRDARFPHHTRVCPQANPVQNAEAIAAFLDVPAAQAMEIAEDRSLFAD